MNALSKAAAPGDADTFSISFLGGLGEIGMNCMVMRRRGAAVLVDCGSMFGGASEIGVSRYVPDLDQAVENASVPDGLVLTHGHEDHIGAVPCALERWPDIPIFGTRFTLALLRAKLEEYNVEANLVEVRDWEPFEVAGFLFTPVPVAHNVPDGLALCIDFAEARVFHSGDLKLDASPRDGRDLFGPRLGELLSLRQVDVLLLDSTNANVPGRTSSEVSLHSTIDELVSGASSGQIICSTFASNVHRHAAFIEAAQAAGRSVYVSGRSIERTTGIALELGMLSPKTPLSFPSSPKDLTASRESTFVLTTGSQAEPRSGLTLMARGHHRLFNVSPGDVVILSSSRVPGNERAIADLASGLMRRGASVFDVSNCDIHASGHAAEADLRDIIAAVRPRSVIPIHGEFRHLTAQSRNAISAGVDEARVHLCVDGTTVFVTSDGVVSSSQSSLRRVAADDFLREIGHDAVQERNYLGTHGVLVAVIALDVPPVVTLRQAGWLSEEAFEAVGPLMEAEVARSVAGLAERGEWPSGVDGCERAVRRALGPLVAEIARGRKPRLVPVVVDRYVTP